ncbi:hypothetical protein BDQ17DRAFT_1322357 [Cyathus striatus]|nr:hypothetical protein BDQ17DRAFT_1322357 [Cyathus striatus]
MATTVSIDLEPAYADRGVQTDIVSEGETHIDITDTNTDPPVLNSSTFTSHLNDSNPYLSPYVDATYGGAEPVSPNSNTPVRTPSPSSPESVVIVGNKSPQVPKTFLRDDTSKDSAYIDENGWVSWTTSPQPIPALHGPLSLPYARCPSGAEGTIIEGKNLSRAVWGLNTTSTAPTQSKTRRRSHQSLPAVEATSCIPENYNFCSDNSCSRIHDGTALSSNEGQSNFSQPVNDMVSHHSSPRSNWAYPLVSALIHNKWYSYLEAFQEMQLTPMFNRPYSSPGSEDSFPSHPRYPSYSSKYMFSCLVTADVSTQANTRGLCPDIPNININDCRRNAIPNLTQRYTKISVNSDASSLFPSTTFTPNNVLNNDTIVIPNSSKFRCNPLSIQTYAIPKRSSVMEKDPGTTFCTSAHAPRYPGYPPAPMKAVRSVNKHIQELNLNDIGTEGNAFSLGILGLSEQSQKTTGTPSYPEVRQVPIAQHIQLSTTSSNDNHEGINGPGQRGWRRRKLGGRKWNGNSSKAMGC